VKAIWIDEGNDADIAKLDAHGITAPYFSIRDPRVTSAYLGGLATAGFAPGLYVAWNWYPELTGTTFAQKLHAELRRIGWIGNPPVCVDIEAHDPAYIRAFLKRWRELRPKRRTDWTLEGMQGGWIEGTPGFVAAVIAANVGVVPQFYRGDMSPLTPGVILDLLLAGIPGDRLMGFYDAAALPYRWHGYAFSQGRLP
jgi:hypothetical protein